MKAHTIRERDEESGEWDGQWMAWLRVARLDIESLRIKSRLTADSAQDDEYIYLGKEDTQTLYKAMMDRGKFCYQFGTDDDHIELAGDRQTFEWSEGRSAVRDLEPVG